MSLFTLRNQKKILVEASAGTGKTYSLAILFIKAVLQTKDIKKVLAVTFTEAAVAELKDRVRLFVLQLVHKSDPDLLAKFQDEKIDIEVLQKMLIEIDHAPIYTIHGFCLQMLEHFSIDVQQNHLAELNNDLSVIITPLCYDYYIQKILHHPEKKDISLEYLTTIAQGIVQGFPFAYDDADFYRNEAEKIKNDFKNFEAESKIIDFKAQYENSKGHYRKFLEKHALIDANFDTKKAYEEISKNTTGYISQLKNLYSKTQFINPALDYSRLIDTLEFIDWFKEKYSEEKPKYSFYTYDDLINKFHHAIQNKSFSQKVSALYPYVFIDEFQDTDSKQYDIFKQCFIQNRPGHTVYLIGDPKQAIYGFRGADIDAYLQAKNDIPKEDRMSLDINYRSTKNFIHQQNTIFDAFNREENFFLKDGIEYEPIKSGSNKMSDDEIPFQIHVPEEEFSLHQNIVNQIQYLQSNGEKLSEIAILIRKNPYAKNIQYELNKANINHVLFADKSVFDTYEAYTVRLLLESLHDVKYKTMNTFLILGKIATIEMDHLSDQNQQDLYYRWIQWSKIADSGRIYVAIQEILQFFLIENTEQISNISHIGELLQEQQTQHHWNVYQCLQWLCEQIVIKNNQDFNTRVFDDRDAVKIMTIHKSKGLEFDHVFVVGVEDDIEIGRMNSVTYKKDGKMVFNIKPFINSDKEIIQQYGLEEIRRLFYVAVTRARKACYIYKNSKKKNLDSIYEILQAECSVIKRHTISNKDHKDLHDEPLAQKEHLQFGTKNLVKQHWYKMSFSSLTGVHSKSAIEEGETTSEFDQFIFKTIGKGTYIGTKLHKLFENLPFGELNHLDFKEQYKVFNTISKDHDGNLTEIDNTHYIETFVDHIWNSNLIENEKLCLKDINPKNVIHELEFNFITESNISELKNLFQRYEKLTDEFKVHLRDGLSTLVGMMNGFIDCFFEHKGKYYILDWKSNYLGNTVQHYQKEHLIQTMNESNYHLQYLIYTVAMHRYLEKYINNYSYDTHFGGVLYLFVRGIRENESSGIMMTKPPKEFILELNNCFKS